MISFIKRFITPYNNVELVVAKYFDALNKYDIPALSELYSDVVILSEWDQNVFVGKQKVLDANKELFTHTPTIQIITSGITNNTSINEIVVLLDSYNIVKVVDSITVVDNKIVKIMAYRGF